MDLNRLLQNIDSQQATGSDTSAGAPVHLWSPQFCGDIPLTIKSDGSWFYQGTPIGRQKLVSLFASVLKREGDNYFLVTPVEKVGIEVEDVPFLIVDWQQIDNAVWVTTLSGEHFCIDETHPVECRFFPKESDAQVPYIKVRTNLWARLHQNVFYQMIEAGHHEAHGDQIDITMQSDGSCFSLGQYQAGPDETAKDETDHN